MIVTTVPTARAARLGSSTAAAAAGGADVGAGWSVRVSTQSRARRDVRSSSVGHPGFGPLPAAGALLARARLDTDEDVIGEKRYIKVVVVS
jgi:hypothetical protein